MSGATRFDPVADAARAYHGLLFGRIATCGKAFTSPYTGSDEPPDDYASFVAEPWWAELRELARSDGLEIETFVGLDWQAAEWGELQGTAAANLLPMSGRRDPHIRIDSPVIGRRIPAGRFAAWGERIRVARERSAQRTGLPEPAS